MAGDDDRQRRKSPLIVNPDTIAVPGVLTVAPAMVSAYLLSKGRTAAGGVLLVVWVPLFALLARSLERRWAVRMWITLTGGILVFAVAVIVFFWLPTP